MNFMRVAKSLLSGSSAVAESFLLNLCNTVLMGLALLRSVDGIVGEHFVPVFSQCCDVRIQCVRELTYHVIGPREPLTIPMKEFIEDFFRC